MQSLQSVGESIIAKGFGTLNCLSSFATVYEELAQLYSSNYNDKIIIAKVDATVIDSGTTIRGYPTIKLYPAGRKKSPINYSGSRTVEDLAKFIKENGVHAVDALLSSGKDFEETAKTNGPQIETANDVSSTKQRLEVEDAGEKSRQVQEHSEL